MTAPPVQGLASCIISHGAVSISRGEAARNEVDEHGPDGAEPCTPWYKGICTLGRLQRTGDILTMEKSDPGFRFKKLLTCQCEMWVQEGHTHKARVAKEKPL